MRLVSLLPSATEILFAIGAGGEVVGVTHECDYPPEAANLPVVTNSVLDHLGQTAAQTDRHIRTARHEGSSIYRLDESLLKELRPDLIVTQELCDVCAVAYADVQRAARHLPGEAAVLSLEPTSLDDIFATIVTIGEMTGRSPQAESLIAHLRRRVASVESLPPVHPTPAVVCVEWTDPLMVGGHWAPELVRRAGGRDPLGRQRQPSHYVDWSDIVAAQPDVMVFQPCGYSLARSTDAAEHVVSQPEFAALPCARTGRVAAVDGSSYFNRPGPRIVDGLEILASILRTRPGGDLPSGAAWVEVCAATASTR